MLPLVSPDAHECKHVSFRPLIVREFSEEGIMAEYEHILVERDEPIAVVRLNRPKVLNALSVPLMTELVTAVVELDVDPVVRCIVLTGNERAFAAGADIAE